MDNFNCIQIKENMKREYLIKNREELFKLISEKDGEFKYVVLFNRSVIYELSDGSFAVVPDGFTSGIWVANNVLLDSFIAQKRFPIESALPPHLVDAQNIIRTKDSVSLIKYANIIINLLDIEDSKNSSSGYFEDVSKKIGSYGQDNIKKDYFFELSIFLGDLFIKKFGGTWGYKTVYLLNPVVVPVIEKRSDYSGNILCIDIWNEMKAFSCKKGSNGVLRFLEHLHMISGIEPVVLSE
jgi:hypothetical protein